MAGSGAKPMAEGDPTYLALGLRLVELLRRYWVQRFWAEAARGWRRLIVPN